MYEILENNEYPDIISWTDDGKAIVIHNQERFTNELYPSKLGSSCQTASWKNIHRCLNYYGFKWKGKVNQISHKDFQRGRNQATRKYGKVEAQILWTQCELCEKWHELPSFLLEKNLPKEFHCSMNFWNREYSSCEEQSEEGATDDVNGEYGTSNDQDEEEDNGESGDEENENGLENQVVDAEVDDMEIEGTTDDEEYLEEQALTKFPYTTFPNQVSSKFDFHLLQLFSFF